MRCSRRRLAALDEADEHEREVGRVDQDEVDRAGENGALEQGLERHGAASAESAEALRRAGSRRARSAAASRSGGPPAARIRSSCAVRRPLARGRRRTPTSWRTSAAPLRSAGSSHSSSGATTGATSRPMRDERLPGGLAHPPRFVGQERDDEAAPTASRRPSTPCDTRARGRAECGSSRSRSEQRSASAECAARRVSSAAARTFGEPGRA